MQRGDPRIAVVVSEAAGQRYYYGAGGPSSPWPNSMFDCGGFVGRALARCGLISHKQADTNSGGWWSLCTPLRVGQQTFGDIAAYGKGTVTHVTLVVSPPQAGGHSYVVGANGGGRATKGDDPSACVQLEKPGYRASDLIGYGRVSRCAPPTAADRAVVALYEAVMSGASVASVLGREPTAAERAVLARLYPILGTR